MISDPNNTTLQPAIEIVNIVKSIVAHSEEPDTAIFRASRVGYKSIRRCRLAEQDVVCGGAKYCNQNCRNAIAKPTLDNIIMATEYTYRNQLLKLITAPNKNMPPNTQNTSRCNIHMGHGETIYSYSR